MSVRAAILRPIRDLLHVRHPIRYKSRGGVMSSVPIVRVRAPEIPVVPPVPAPRGGREAPV